MGINVKTGIIMPRGKYKGMDLADLPSSYLRWVVDEFDTKEELSKDVRTAAQNELEQRDKYNCHFEDVIR